MMKILKKAVCLISVLLLFVVFCLPVSASITLNCYGSVTPNTTQIQYLRSEYINSNAYNPFAHYLYCRSGQYEYKLLIEQGNKGYVIFTLTTNNNNTYSISSTHTVDDKLNINTNGYTVVSDINFDKTVYSRDLEGIDLYNYRWTLFISVVALLIVVIFFVFHNKINWFRISGGIDI